MGREERPILRHTGATAVKDTGRAEVTTTCLSGGSLGHRSGGGDLPAGGSAGIFSAASPGRQWGKQDCVWGEVELWRSCNKGFSQSHQKFWSWGGLSKLAQVKTRRLGLCTSPCTGCKRHLGESVTWGEAAAQGWGQCPERNSTVSFRQSVLSAAGGHSPELGEGGLGSCTKGHQVYAPQITNLIHRSLCTRNLAIHHLRPHSMRTNTCRRELKTSW